jgi:hypothetical protein
MLPSPLAPRLPWLRMVVGPDAWLVKSAWLNRKWSSGVSRSNPAGGDATGLGRIQ